MSRREQLLAAIRAVDEARRLVKGLDLIGWQRRQKTVAEVELRQAEQRLISLADIWKSEKAS